MTMLLATIPTGAIAGLIIAGILTAGLWLIIYLHLPPRCPKCKAKQENFPVHGWRRCWRCDCKFDPVTGKRL